MGRIINPNTGAEFDAASASNGKDLPRVCVGILAGGSMVDSAFAETFSGALIGNDQLFHATQMWVHGGIPDKSRNMIVQAALERDFDYVFFMDSDMTFPKGALGSMLISQMEILSKWPEHRDTPTVMGGIYSTRSDHRLNTYDWDEDLDAFIVSPMDPHTGVYKRDFVATGCQLIDLGIFEGMDFPWFEYWWKPFGKDGKIDRWSEDAVFGKKCYDLGIPHFVNSNVVCKHIHSCLLSPVSAEEYQLEKLHGGAYHDSVQRSGEVSSADSSPAPAEEMSQS